MSKKNKYYMDISQANDTLQKVFEACEAPPNIIPFDKILLRQKVNTRVYKIGTFFCIVSLLLVFLAPLYFPHSQATMERKSSANCDLFVANHYATEDTFVLTVTGQDPDFKNSYAVNQSGTVFSPISYDGKTNTVCFAYTHEILDIYVPDSQGDSLHLIITPK